MGAKLVANEDAGRLALEQVPHSQTFSRSERLRKFPRYVREMQISGQGDAIKESLIGVEVFKRPQNYSTAGDSSVRSRAWELRRSRSVRQPGGLAAR